ncbi:MAG: FAD-dependent thymidylate synthase [Vicingus serpentipes]|nr:FAD-dependent thymidylate synthase [Vicingus serpentipes]
MVYCARVSSSRSDKFDKPEGLLKYCIENKHWSIFETGSLTFEIETSKAIAIQLLRHRSFTFQEFSQRYADVSKSFDDSMFEEVEIRKQAETNRQSSTDIFDPNIDFNTPYGMDASEAIALYLNTSEKLYESLLEAGIARECARMILPMCTKTRLYMTGSVRSWIHFLNIRLDRHAQKEIVEISKEIAIILTKELPIIAKATSNFNNYEGNFT